MQADIRLSDLGAKPVADPRHEVLQALGEAFADKVVRAVIARFRRMPPHISEDVLKHFWDEVCAQVQGEESVVWDLYQEIVSDTVCAIVSDWSTSYLQAVWLLTDAGFDWLFEDEHTAVPVNLDDIVAFLEQRVYDVAADVENPRIELFNAREHD